MENQVERERAEKVRERAEKDVALDQVERERLLALLKSAGISPS